MEITYSVKEINELKALQNIFSIDFAIDGRVNSSDKYTLLTMLERSGIDEKIEAKKNENAIAIGGSFNIKKGIRLNSLLPITGCDIKQNSMRLFMDFSGYANSGGIDIIILELWIYEE